jgi:hypothetical protein
MCMDELRRVVSRTFAEHLQNIIKNTLSWKV